MPDICRHVCRVHASQRYVFVFERFEILTDFIISIRVQSMSVEKQKAFPSESSKERMLTAVGNLAHDLEQMVENGRKSYEASRDVNDFVQSRGSSQLHGLLTVYPVSIYAKCFASAGVQTRKELEEVWSRYFTDAEVREAVERLLSAEAAYVSFIDELDKELNTYEEDTASSVARVGECLPADLPLVQARSGESVQLGDVLKKNKMTLFVLRKHYV